MIIVNALPIHWEPFIQSINGREDLPLFDHLWVDCTQEETKIIARGVQDSHHNDNQALASHAKRFRRNRTSFNKAFKDKKTSTTLGHEHRKDISKIQCFRCDKYDTLREIVLPGRNEDNMHPLQMLNHLREMKT
jgi:hypothetical protein